MGRRYWAPTPSIASKPCRQLHRALGSPTSPNITSGLDIETTQRRRSRSLNLHTTLVSARAHRWPNLKGHAIEALRVPARDVSKRLHLVFACASATYRFVAVGTRPDAAGRTPAKPTSTRRKGDAWHEDTPCLLGDGQWDRFGDYTLLAEENTAEEPRDEPGPFAFA